MHKKLKKVFNLYTLFFVCILLAGLALGYKRIINSDFYAINGDFQNYNIFRRVLDGQFPYSDFANYLGMGTILTNVPFLLISGTFTDSLFVTQVTSCMIFAISVALLSYMASKNKKLSLTIGAVSPFFYSITSQFSSTYFLTKGFKLVEPGNSMRTTRSFLPYLIILIFFVIAHFYSKRHGKPLNILDNIRNLRFVFVMGLILGALVMWSNDFGFACIGSATILWLLLLIGNKSDRFTKTLKAFGMYALGGIIGAFVSVFISTGGNIKSFISFTTGVAEYQYWYYGSTTTKLTSIFDIFSSYYYSNVIIFFLTFVMIFIIKMILKKTDNLDILLMFAYASTILASLIYAYGSGGYAYEAAFLATTMITVFYVAKALIWLVKYFKEILHKKSQKASKSRKLKVTGKVTTCVTAFLLACVITVNACSAYKYADDLNGERVGTYVEGLDGYTKYGKSILMAKEIIGDKQIFSTYASALETVTDQFQPSGIDYIIHALGDEQREHYIKTFLEGNYEYASTIRGDYTTYEYWARRTNWFFYRELYKNYVPCFVTDYSIIWKRSNTVNKVNADAKITVTEINKDTVLLKINIPEYSDTVIADIKISYSTSWTKGRWSRLEFKKLVSVFDGISTSNAYTPCYYLPQETDEYYIPLVVENGQANLVISSQPSECTSLDNFKAEIVTLYDYDTVTVERTEWE